MPKKKSRTDVKTGHGVGGNGVGSGGWSVFPASLRGILRSLQARQGVCCVFGP